MNKFSIMALPCIFFVFGFAPLLSQDANPNDTPAVSPPHLRIHLRISREYKSDSCISGYLAVENKVIAYTLERPDVANLNGFSAVPSGDYPAYLRYDKNDNWRIQLKNVPRRTDVQIHIGNQVTDSGGCILVGLQLGADLCSLEDSSGAYSELKNAFYGACGVTEIPKGLDIRVEIDDPPPPGQADSARSQEGPDPSPGTRHALQEALDDFTDPGTGIGLEFLRGNAALVLGNLSPTPGIARLLLNQLEKESQPLVKGEMIEALGEMGTADPAILPLLTQLADQGKDYEKSFALKGLGAMGSAAQPALKVIRKNLRNQDYFIRQNAKWALSRVRVNSAIKRVK
jgi:hypothetical protein